MNGSRDLAEHNIATGCLGGYATRDLIDLHTPGAGFGSNLTVKTRCHDGTASSPDDDFLKGPWRSHFQISHAGAAKDNQSNGIELYGRPGVQAV